MSFVIKAVLGDLGVLSEYNERAREKVYDSRKDAEIAKESVEMWKRIRTKAFLSDPVHCLEQDEHLWGAISMMWRRVQEVGTLPIKRYPASSLTESEEAGYPRGLTGKEGYFFSSRDKYSKIASTTR